jgi:hypothetical protein
MSTLSDLIIQHPQIESFHHLVALVCRRAEEGEIFIEFDIKPDYVDTPRNWEWVLESAFTRGRP